MFFTRPAFTRCVDVVVTSGARRVGTAESIGTEVGRTGREKKRRRNKRRRKKAEGTLAGAFSCSTGLSAVEIGGSAVVVQTGGFHTPMCSQGSSPGTFPAPFGACHGYPARDSPVAREERCRGCVLRGHQRKLTILVRVGRFPVHGLAVTRNRDKDIRIVGFWSITSLRSETERRFTASLRRR